MELEEGKVGGVGEVVNEVWRDESLQGTAEAKVVGELAEEGLAGEEGGSGDEGGEVAEVKREDVVEVLSFP